MINPAPPREHGPGRSPGPSVSARVLLPVALLLLYGVVQHAYLRPPRSIRYFELAAAWPHVEPDHHGLRIGFVLAERATQFVLGRTEAAYYALPLLAAALLVFSTYWLGRALFSPAVGAASAVLLVFNREFLNGASILLPDLFGTALFTAALAVVVSVALRRQPPSPSWTVHDHRMLVLAGLLLGWSYLVREYIVLVFPMIPVAFAYYHLPWRKILWVAVPAAAVFVGEVVLNGIVHGSPFARFGVSLGHGGQRDYITDTRWDALARLPTRLAEEPAAATALVPLVLLLFAVFIRRRPYRLVLAWFALFWFVMTLGTGLVEPSFRFIEATMLRYWMPVVPALVIGGAAVAEYVLRAASDWCSRRTGASWAWSALPSVGVVAFALLLGTLGSSDARASHGYKANGADQLDALRGYLARDGSDSSTIWTDPLTARVLPLFTQSTFGDRLWEGRIRDFVRDGRVIDLHDIDGGLIVLHGPGYRRFTGRLTDGRFRIPDARHAIRSFERDPGDRTEVVLRRRDLVVYRIEPGPDPG